MTSLPTAVPESLALELGELKFGEDLTEAELALSTQLLEQQLADLGAQMLELGAQLAAELQSGGGPAIPADDMSMDESPDMLTDLADAFIAAEAKQASAAVNRVLWPYVVFTHQQYH